MSARPAPSVVFGAQARAQERARRAKAEQAKRPELKLVKKEQPKQRLAALSPRSRLFVCFGLAVVLLFALVAFHVLLTQGQFSLQKLQTKANQQQAQYERMRLQVAQLESPSRIQSEAVNRLGMVPADKVTPITPGASELPRSANGGAVPVAGDSSATGDPSMNNDPGAWTSVKPHLSSTNQ
jgi:cell division protein FtsL